MVVVHSLNILGKEATLTIGISSSTDESFIRERTLISRLCQLFKILRKPCHSDFFQFVGDEDKHRLILSKSKRIDLPVLTKSFENKLMIELNISQVEASISVNCKVAVDEIDLIQLSLPEFIDLLIDDDLFAQIS